MPGADAFPTAAAAGFRMPAEWAPHERCWMAWPCRATMWGERLGDARAGWAAVANAIAEFEPVTMLARAEDTAACRGLLSNRVTVLPAAIDDSWMRDTGPNFVVDDNGELAASLFLFNAWGGKHAPFASDAAIGHRVAERLGLRTFTSALFLEGGAVNVDGEGTLLTTGQCVLHENRNPGLDRAAAERVLCDALGASSVIWLPGDPEDTETDGHIDGIACFVSAGRVLVELCPARGTKRYDTTRANLAALRGRTDANGRTLEIETIEEAWEATRTSDIYAATYVNYYVANGAVIMPAFGIDRDADARATLARLYPDREIVQLDVTAIAFGGGGIHCMTQQQPVARGAAG